jgi:hypothetical protein
VKPVLSRIYREVGAGGFSRVGGSVHIVFTDINGIAGIFVDGELITLDVFPYTDSLAHDGTLYSAGWAIEFIPIKP